MMDILAFEDLMTLRQPFAANEHEFKGGYCYITEQAVTTRLEDVDPAWTLQILSQTTRDNHAIATVRLTVKGVSRDGVGMQALTITDKKTGEVKENPSEPEKGAVTDALKRAARLFGIGRYLLDLPDSVRDIDAMARWLAASGKVPTVNGKPAPVTPMPETKVGFPVTILNDAYLMVKNVMERTTFDVIMGTLELPSNASPQTIAKAAITAHKAREKKLA